MQALRRSWEVIGVLIGLMLWLVAATAKADVLEHDRYHIHYTVLPTVQLSPDVARAYDLTRSRNRTLVNIVILEKADPSAEGVRSFPARIVGHTVNLNQQVRPLRFREVRDGEAVYHLAEARAHPGEVLDFRIDIRVTDDPQSAIPLSFRKTIY
jgi:hypothetical protein